MTQAAPRKHPGSRVPPLSALCVLRMHITTHIEQYDRASTLVLDTILAHLEEAVPMTVGSLLATPAAASGLYIVVAGLS